MVNDIFKNVEYMYITYAGKSVVTFKGVEIEGKNKAEIQYLLGEKFGEKNFHYSIKIKGKLKNETGGIRGIKIGTSTNEFDNMDIKEINSIRKELNELKSHSNLDLITKLIEDKHQLEIKHLNEKLVILTKEKLEFENAYNDIVKEIEKKENGNSDLLTSLLKYLPMDKILSGITPGASLSNRQDSPINNQISIHPEILNVLNKVDYTKLSDQQVKQYASILNSFVNDLPKKE